MPQSFPTMITPFTSDGRVDYTAVRLLVDWYYKNGCAGIFASCQSSEIHCLCEDDRVRLALEVKIRADELAAANPGRPRMTVVASGHISDSPADQIRELTRVAETGVDAVILITNRMDIANTSDAAWIAETEALLAELPKDMPLGLYECPRPYKRLLTPAMLRFVRDTGRFRFIKDTCCDADEIARRMEILAGSDLLLYNANAQTLLPSLRSGAAGYCGIMANFHPALYSWLCDHFDDPEAEEVADFLSISAFTEQLAYPVTAKYHLSEIEGIRMPLYSLTRDPALFTPYNALCVRQMDRMARRLMEKLKL